MDLVTTLLYLCPEEEWAVDDNNYDNLIWLSNTVMPSKEEVFSAWPLAKAANLFELLRVKRNSLLMESDWTQMPDVSVDADAWAEYRQALRDLPANTIDPENPVWPTPPE